MGEQITVVRGKRNVVLRSLENVENELKNIKQNFGSRDVSSVDRLSGLKSSHEDKIKKVKLIDEELLPESGTQDPMRTQDPMNIRLVCHIYCVHAYLRRCDSTLSCFRKLKPKRLIFLSNCRSNLTISIVNRAKKMKNE